MIRLIYFSTMLQGLPESMTRGIVETSRATNRRAGVTGMLISDGAHFLQALEGDAAAVDATYERIQADPRHRACVLLDRRPIGARAFDGWDLAWQPVPGAAPGATPAQTLAALTAQIAEPSLRALFDALPPPGGPAG